MVQLIPRAPALHARFLERRGRWRERDGAGPPPGALTEQAFAVIAPALDRSHRET
ncbi:hypothetical protein [Streptomyces tendae]